MYVKLYNRGEGTRRSSIQWFGIIYFQAIDLDDGDNAKISYYLDGEVKETLTEGLENLAVSPFLVDIDTGAVSLNFDPQKGMKGYFDFKVGFKLKLHIYF